MFGHITLGCDNWERAKPFWLAVMDVLGHPLFMETDAGAAFGEATGQKTFIGPAFNGEPAAPGNGVHIAYLAKDRETVDAFYAAAMAHGGSDEGPPGLRPHYHPNYYGAYVRDPDGNKLQAVCHSAKG
ncbi:VOC family protein [Parasphingopyxis algicola]|uniref:VOC family protein n=1 Tax=Parasphingopyxis algicola TaxID=2026624 RepID=UPI00159FF1FA|nr:VOC family protein [Parasphingopyxis algicola]QLC25042.1 VOC family protein [Parasphingopyxis algicola]